MQKIPIVQQHTPTPMREGKIHVRLTEGRFQNLRRLLSWPLILLFFGLVWVEYDQQPWLLFSFEQHRLILFGHALSWQSLPLLAGLMVAGACLLFFMAVGWGRVWCGFACPQSIWTWIFLRIEQWTEGRPRQRARIDQSRWQATHLGRRLAKHLLWLSVAFATALTFTGYFVPIREMLADFTSGNLSLTLAGWLLTMTLLTYLNAGLVREKICLHACPYSRFQGVMFDRHTRTVSYDSQRGEPRGKAEGAGDCVDCGICVQVCPTGIDIRNGLQAACIDCGACIDACDQVMDKLERPRGLIRFASEAALAGQRSPHWRPRLLGYGAIMLMAGGAVWLGFGSTQTLMIDVQRDRQSLFTRLDEETVCNRYYIKLETVLDNRPKIEVSVSGEERFTLHGPRSVELGASNAQRLPYRVCASGLGDYRQALTFLFHDGEQQYAKETTFLSGPSG
ncbi:cytochrome c oxidase accessory protein CcoG [Marinobacterium sp. AK62]|uniref:Cytochrome c oxidase accessory protein CcoG n=1 Tax=Marinobacterium alkalitolerans TaxID=1542925 RepID=A0ABS3ZDQ2_9GAMM|nr:cytochrome c oxidase accessory protein CcoG [Marinobacterium alkalitolerans]MBP0049455.1 cytochrome c oxidase accessory protein CcoG [Marinobacterium alkalitolerans]